MNKEQGGNVHEHHRQRMRERVKRDGLRSLEDHEILEYLLFPFIPRKDTNPIAHRLIEAFGSLAGVFMADPQLLREVRGMTDSAALYISVYMQVDERCRKSLAWNLKLPDPYSVAKYAGYLFKNMDEERIYLLGTGRDDKAVSLIEAAKGSERECFVSEKKLAHSLAGCNAAHIYILHNHLEDKARPSYEDIEFTKRAVKLFKGEGIKVADHLIVGRKQVFSFAFNELLPEEL